MCAVRVSAYTFPAYSYLFLRNVTDKNFRLQPCNRHNIILYCCIRRRHSRDDRRYHARALAFLRGHSSSRRITLARNKETPFKKATGTLLNSDTEEYATETKTEAPLHIQDDRLSTTHYSENTSRFYSESSSAQL